MNELIKYLTDNNIAHQVGDVLRIRNLSGELVEVKIPKTLSVNKPRTKVQD